MSRSNNKLAHKAAEKRRKERRYEEVLVKSDHAYTQSLSKDFGTHLQQLSQEEKVAVSRNLGLRNYLLILSSGHSMTPRSGVYSHIDPSGLLSTVEKAIDEVLPHLSREFGDKIKKFDLRQVEKFGPQGGTPPGNEAALQLAEEFAAGPQPTLFGDSKWHHAIILAASLLGFTRILSPLQTPDVVNRMQSEGKLATNSGMPFFTKRSIDVVRQAAITSAIDGSCYQYPAVALYRYYNHKLRPVWMFPMGANVLESSYTFVLEDAIRTSANPKVRAFFSPWEGFTQVEQFMTWMWPSQRCVGGDIHAMDAFFKRAQMRQAYLLAREAFLPSYWGSLEVNMMHVNEIPIIVGPANKLVGWHGVASGSSWTQMAETLFQFICYCYLAITQGCSGYIAVGDDSASFWPELHRERKDFYIRFFASVGLPANLEKQYDEEDEIVFLQRLFLRSWKSRDDKNRLGGIYPIIRALKSIVYPEHRHDKWNDDMECLRLVSILENCVNHPLYEWFTEWIANGFPPLIAFAQRTADELKSVVEQYAGVPGVFETYNREKKDKSLSSYDTIHLIKSLSMKQPMAVPKR
jgi:hypothetical protein